jgi:hypothetical protein
MLLLFVTVTIFQYSETVKPAVYMLDCDSVSGQTEVESSLFFGESAAFRLFERRYAESVKSAYALKTLVSREQSIFVNVYAAPPEHFEIMNRTLCFAHANYLAALSVYHNQILYCVIFLLPRVRFFLFFLGRSVSCSLTSTITIVIGVFPALFS